MVIVKIKRDISGENRYLKNAVRYVHDKKGVPPIFLSGNGVDYTSAQKAFDQMYAVKQYFGKTSGNPLVHFMICFDKSVTTADIATRLSWSAAAYFMHDYQYIVCKHFRDHDFNHYHCHIVLNSVSFKDGKMIHTGRAELEDYCKYISRITEQTTKFEFCKNDEKSRRNGK